MPRRIEAVIKAKGAPTNYWVHIQYHISAHRAHHMQTAPRLSTQGRLSGKQPGKPGQHITVTGNTRARAPLTRHTIPLSSISTSKLFTENVGIGVCWDQTLCKPPDIN